MLLSLGVLIGTASLAKAADHTKRHRELTCMAVNMYHEARGESSLGVISVGFVTLNRSRDKHFPSTICRVIHQGGDKSLYGCQFTWYCDGLSDHIRNWKRYNQLFKYAEMIYDGKISDPTGGALYYHSIHMKRYPYWIKDMVALMVIDNHRFYAPRRVLAGRKLLDRPNIYASMGFAY